MCRAFSKSKLRDGSEDGKGEGRPRRDRGDEGRPTKAEWDDHRVDHIPYRSWCPFCVKGRGVGIQHRKSTEKSSVPVFGFDYLLGSEAISSDEEDNVKIIVAKCQYTK